MAYHETWQDGVLLDRVWREDEYVGIGLQDTIATVKAQIYGHAGSILSNAVSQYSAAEMTSWERKEQEARSVLRLGNATESPSLAIEAAAAEISIDQLAQIVVAKANGYRNLAARVAGIRSKHIAVIESMTTVEAVTSYDWSAGWP